MSVATNRRCRTCPAIFSGAGDADRCDVCRQSAKDPAAVELGRRGGAKGGPARAAALTPEQRHDVASHAAQTRWAKERGEPPPPPAPVHRHAACSHYLAILEPVRAWIKDVEWCAICGAETPEDAPDGSPVPHLDGCALLALIGPAEDREAR